MQGWLVAFITSLIHQPNACWISKANEFLGCTDDSYYFAVLCVIKNTFMPSLDTCNLGQNMIIIIYLFFVENSRNCLET